jgi:hypothetical protein
MAYTSGNVTPVKAVVSKGPSKAEEILAKWAAGLTPSAAPKPADKGPLAWVRETKVPELLAELKKAGVA